MMQLFRDVRTERVADIELDVIRKFPQHNGQPARHNYWPSYVH
jgi:hypothetical protein